MSWRYLFELSYKNLVSQKSRSILTIGGVGIGISAIVFLVSLGYGLQRLAINETIRTKSLNIIDVSVGTGAIAKIDQDVITSIRGLNNIKDLYPRLETPVRFGLKDREAGADLIAFINNESYTKQTDTLVYRGRLPENGQKETIVTTGALNSIGLNPQHALNSVVEIEIILRSELMPGGVDRELDKLEMTIVGIVDDNENPYVLMPIDPVKELVGEFAFTSAKVEVFQQDQIEAARSQITDMGLGVEYIGDTVNELENIFGVVRTVLAGFGLVATMVAALGMFNTLSVSLLERTREIGIMKTFGTKRSEVWRLFLIEGILISILGGLVGIVLGVLGGEGLNLVFNLVAAITGNPIVDFYYSPPLFLAIILLLVLFLGTIVGLIPARRATKISPLNALRYE